METLSVECLRCGDTRAVSGERHSAGECPRCGYLGWALSEELSELVRRSIREKPPESRRLRLVW